MFRRLGGVAPCFVRAVPASREKVPCRYKMADVVFAAFPPAMDISSAFRLAVGQEMVAGNVEAAISTSVKCFVKEGFVNVADLRLAFHSDPTRRD